MKKVDSSGATGSNTFTDGDAGTGVPATVVDSSWLNAVQTEIVNVVLDSDSGITQLSQDNSSLDQLITAIRAIIDVKIAAGGGGGGGGGGATGTLVKTSEASVSSDQTTTNTSNVDVTGSLVAYTPIAAANDRFVDVFIDHSLLDADGSSAEAVVDLMKSTDGSSYSAVKSFNLKSLLTSGKIEVNRQVATLGADTSTNSQSNVTTGLQLDYTPVSSTNTRLVQLFVDYSVLDDNGGAAYGILALQYYNGSSWVDLEEFTTRVTAVNANNTRISSPVFYEYEHTVTDASPQYRLVHRLGNSGDTSEVFAGSFIKCIEIQQLSNNEQRSPVFFTYRDTATVATPYYKLQHRATNGDTSVVKAGSMVRVREFN